MPQEAIVTAEITETAHRPHYADGTVSLYYGDCIDVMRQMPDSSVDSIVTDPPYGLGFMGKAWDDLPPGLPFAQECLRVLKPGGHILAFGGTRTSHRLVCAIEDAGFEIRDSIAWLYGTGMPKSLNLVGPDGVKTGWGTGLKPSHEPIAVGRKPIIGTVAANVAEFGTGALHIEATRVGDGADRSTGGANGSTGYEGGWRDRPARPTGGRWPTNIALDESQSATLGDVGRYFPAFHYQSKAPRSERVSIDGASHPTVKPLDLMRWLARLVTPPGGIVLEPFAGSGTTVEACILEDFRCIAIEREGDYLPLILERINRQAQHAVDHA